MDFTSTVPTNAQNVSSGLWKGMDNAIVDVYAGSPPGVSDRVRKGFQAVTDRDWKVAKVWFEDALNRDPGNAGLKRLVALTDPSPKPKPPPAKSDARPNQTKPASAATANPNLQLPDPNDIYILFPGAKPVEDKELMDVLFGLDASARSQTSGDPKSAKAEPQPDWNAFFEKLNNPYGIK